jgi:hypothetical protein
MELKEFIKNTLVSIKEGVNDANTELATNEGKTIGEDGDCLQYTMHDSKSHSINFDVAVVVNNENEEGMSGGGKLNISIASIGAEAKGKEKQTETNTTRIKFNITPRKEIY